MKDKKKYAELIEHQHRYELLIYNRLGRLTGHRQYITSSRLYTSEVNTRIARKNAIVLHIECEAFLVEYGLLITGQAPN